MFEQMRMTWTEIPKDLKMEDIPSRSEADIMEMINKLPDGIHAFVHSIDINIEPEALQDISERDILDAFLSTIQLKSVCAWKCPVVLYRDERTVFAIQFLFRDFVKFESEKLAEVIKDVVERRNST